MSMRNRWIDAGRLGLLAAALATATPPAGAEGAREVVASSREVVDDEAGTRSPPPGATAPTARAGDPNGSPTAIDPPARLGSSLPALAEEGATTAVRGHEVLMTWLEPAPGSAAAGSRLRFARLSVDGWSQPVTIAQRVSTLGAGGRASLTVFDTQGVRRTLIARTGDVLARSGDAGRTWSRLPAPLLPHASFAGGDEGGFGFWLEDLGMGKANLLGTRILAGGTVLDARTDWSSGSSAAMTWDGPVVVYRAERSDGTFEIASVHRADARWTAPVTVYAEGWRPEAGPRLGPRMAAFQRHVAVVWTSGSPPHDRLLVAFSPDGGKTFGNTVEVDARADGRAPTGAVDVDIDDQGRALVLWLTSAGDTRARLELARVAPEGKRGEALVLAEGLAADTTSVPGLVRADQRVAVAWTEGTPTRVRAVTVPLAGIAAPPESEPAKPAADEVRPAGPYVPRGRVGDPAPDLELAALDGEAVSLPGLRGRAVLLNLWATWCIPCIAEMPELAAIGERYGDRGLELIGVTVDGADDRDKVDAFIAERRVPFTVWLDPEMELFAALRVRGLPVTLVIDREGRIVWRRNRPITAEDPSLAKALDGVVRDDSE